MKKLALYPTDETVIKLESDHDPVRPTLRLVAKDFNDEEPTIIARIVVIDRKLVLVVPKDSEITVKKEGDA
jgi:hypothetical protein